MNPQILAVWVIIGAIIGLLATMVVKGSRFGTIGDVIAGIVGAVVSGLALTQVGLPMPFGFDPVVIYALIGALILITALRVLSR